MSLNSEIGVFLTMGHFFWDTSAKVVLELFSFLPFLVSMVKFGTKLKL